MHVIITYAAAIALAIVLAMLGFWGLLVLEAAILVLIGLAFLIVQTETETEARHARRR